MTTVRSGQLVWRSGAAYVRIRTGATRRTLIRLVACDSERAARQRIDRVTALVDRLIAAGRANVGLYFATRAAKASDEKELRGIERAVEALTASPHATGEATTFREFSERWVSGVLHREYPDHVPVKRTADDDRYQLNLYINPVIGDIPLGAITIDHAEEIMRRLPAHLSRPSRRHVAQVLRRVLSLAASPARLIARSPLTTGFLPRIERRKAFSYLFPDEDAALLGCSTIDLARRVLYGLLAREGLRAGEATGLTWSDLDLTRGIVRLDSNKTDDPRAWALEASVVVALREWRSRHHPHAAHRLAVFARADGAALHLRADAFRRDLLRAGVTRAELFERSPTRSPIRIHDLRTTFVTVSLANGRTETWVADRTGHRSSEMINRYRRPARTHRELGLGVLSPLASAIPELRPEGAGGHQLGTSEASATNPSSPDTPVRLSGEQGIRTLGSFHYT